MPHVAGDASEEDIGVTALEAAHKRHLRNGMALSEIFAQEESINPRGVTAHDYILIIVRKNLGLDEIARAEQISDRARFAHRTEHACAEFFRIIDVSALQFFARKRRELFSIAKAEMVRHIHALEPGKRAHANVVKLREQKSVDEMAAIDGELRVIDCFLRNLEPRWTGAQESAAASPIEFGFRFLGARNQIRQIEPEEIVPLNHIRIAFFNETGQAF